MKKYIVALFAVMIALTPLATMAEKPPYSFVDENCETKSFIDCIDQLGKQVHELRQTVPSTDNVVYRSYPLTTKTWTTTSWNLDDDAEAENIKTDASGKLQLTVDLENMLPIHDFMQDIDGDDKREIWDMVVYNDKLMIGICYRPLYGGYGYLYEYTHNSAAPILHRKFTEEEGIYSMRVIDGKLYIPGIDTRLGDDGSVFVYDGLRWVRHTVNDGWQHIRDIVKFGDSFYVTTNSPSARGHGLMKSAGSNISQWSAMDNAIANNMTRLMEVYDGKIFNRGANYIRTWDGSNFEKKPYGTYDSSIKNLSITLYTFKNELYVGAVNRIYKYNKSLDSFENSLELSTPQFTYDFTEHDDKLYAAISEDDETFENTDNPLGRASYWYGTNKKEDASIWYTDGGGTWSKLTDLPEDRVMSLASYGGKLYAGTSSGEMPDNKRAMLYVSGYHETGYLISKPYDTGMANVSYDEISLVYDNATNTRVKLQIRTATSEGGLLSKDFVGSNGTVKDFYTDRVKISSNHNGQRYIQYKVYLETTEVVNTTPILNSISISFKEADSVWIDADVGND